MQLLKMAHWRLLREISCGRPLRVRVTGDCMAPLLADGSRLDVVGAALYWPGDVLMVLPATGGMPFVHRLIGYFWRDGSLHYLTQADNSHQPDAAVTRQRIVGRVRGGQCSSVLARVPIRHRLLALGRFFRYLLHASFHRTWRLLNPS